MKRIFGTILIAVMLVAMAGCGHEHDKEPGLKLSSMWDSSCHTEKMKGYMSDEVQNVLKYATGTSEVSKPEAYHFSWEPVNVKPEDIKEYVFTLASDPVKSEVYYQATVTENHIELYNLFLRKMYFWTVTVVLKNGDAYESEPTDFVTAGDAPRVINVPGVTNCRDLGGWHIAGENYVKQGMIYRTGRMNDNKKDNITIKDEGIAVLKDELGIKTEIDLRQDEIRSTSALGESVNYVNIPMSGNDVYKNLDNLSEGIRSIFSILADEKNYPIQLHCSVGADRTGLISFLINGVLGVSEEQLYRDYLFSNFGKVDGMRQLVDITDSYAAVIKKEEGASLKEQIYNYLVKIGVPSTEIESVRSILTEER